MGAEPIDRYNVAYFIFYLLGLGSLLPWNFFITANEYWKYKFRNVNTSAPISPTTAATLTYAVISNGTNDSVTVPMVVLQPAAIKYSELQIIWGNALSVCAMLPNVIFQFLNTLLQKRIPQNARIIGTLVLMLILFAVTEIFVKVDTDSWQATFFTVTLLLIVVLNSCTAIFQSSVFGVAACFPQKYCAAVMAGQGVGGIFAAVAMIISITVSSDPSASAFIFFLTAIFVVGLTIVGYLVLIRLNFYKHYANVTKIYQSKSDKSFIAATDEKGPEDSTAEIKKLCINDGQDDDENMDNVWAAKNVEGDGGKINDKELECAEDENLVNSKVEVHGWFFWLIVKKVKVHAFCVAFTFFVTLACFPAVTANIKSTTSGSVWSDLYFTPVCCFLLFNLTDWIGRSMASYVHWPSKDNTTVFMLCVLSRAVFLFLFALCNFQPRSVLVLFHNDVAFIVFMILFGLSNGHLSTLSMQYGPKLVAPEHAAMAGSFLAFMIAVGLFAGAGFSFVITKAIS